ncbi:Protein RESTRICTED TEV MOVEMENT 2 [Zea mays]|uniref:Protein RESTRICTED TEV MOVEMENT 2 n=1 Tax=Zea mays TaxID=4577 RepID=A0A317Y0J6_MAIZE|nr:Protein RESTRICTED TEV MOVEMENT 2 [Zea mays]
MVTVTEIPVAGAAGFKREDLRVLVDNHGHLRTRGERHLTGNRWIRFQNDFELPANCNADGIRAKFENETLTITLPKKTPSTPMQPPPRMPTAAPPPLQGQGQGLPPAARPAAPTPAPLAPAAPSVKPPAESRASMPRKTRRRRRKREEEGKMAEDRKEMVHEKDTQQEQQPMLAETMALANLKPRQASARQGMLVSVAVAVVVLLGFTVYVWHSLRNATGGAGGEHGHGHQLWTGSYGDEM